MELDRLKENWEKLGQQDPMWAILSDPSKKGRKWDPASFFQSGEIDIDRLLGEVTAANFPLVMGTALDFGCGLGRLTQALCNHFKKSYGVDISSTMLAEASRYNRFGDACSYVLNNSSDLSCFDDDSFDFVYSHLVLQHIPPEASKQYVSEFVRILKPGGLLIFQAPSEQRSAPQEVVHPRLDRTSVLAAGPDGASAKIPTGAVAKIKDACLRLTANMRHRPSKPQSLSQAVENLENLIDMHCLPREQVVKLVEKAGGRLLQVQEYNSAGPEWASYRYWATKSRE